MSTKTRINGENYTQLPRLVSDDIILKGLPHTPGAPAGYGDLASVVDSGRGFVNVSSFGVVSGNGEDQRQKIQDCIDYAHQNGLCVRFDVPTVRIDGTIYLRGETQGNGVWILNYGNGDAVSIASDATDIHGVVSDLNITYRDHLSPINPYVPEYTLNINIEPRRSLTWNHLSTFSGAGFSHSTNGATFKNLKRCLVYFHYYGFRPCGWSYIHEDCTATACFRGFENNEGLINGKSYPANSISLIKCTYTSNTSFGLKINYGYQVSLVSVNAEKNGEVANIDFNFCDSVSGSIYTEYARAYNSIATRGVQLNVYSTGKKFGSVEFFKDFKSVSQFSATGSGSSFSVPVYDAGTGFGIDNFTSYPSNSVIILKNYKWLARSAWSKTGADITVTTPYVNGDIFHVYVNCYTPWIPTSSRVDPFLMNGGDFFVRFSNTLYHQVSGQIEDFVDGTFTIIDEASLSDTRAVNILARILNTPITRNNAKVGYDIRDGIFYQQEFFGGLSFKNAFDGNLTANVNATIHYPSAGVGSTTVSNAHRFVFMLVSGHGSALFTLDENGNISATGANQAKLTVQTADAAQGGKLNIYSGTANTIRWNNLLGFSTNFQLFRFTV